MPINSSQKNKSKRIVLTGIKYSSPYLQWSMVWTLSEGFSTPVFASPSGKSVVTEVSRIPNTTAPSHAKTRSLYKISFTSLANRSSFSTGFDSSRSSLQLDTSNAHFNTSLYLLVLGTTRIFLTIKTIFCCLTEWPLLHTLICLPFYLINLWLESNLLLKLVRWTPADTIKPM